MLVIHRPSPALLWSGGPHQTPPWHRSGWLPWPDEPACSFGCAKVVVTAIAWLASCIHRSPDGSPFGQPAATLPPFSSSPSSLLFRTGKVCNPPLKKKVLRQYALPMWAQGGPSPPFTANEEAVLALHCFRTPPSSPRHHSTSATVSTSSSTSYVPSTAGEREREREREEKEGGALMHLSQAMAESYRGRAEAQPPRTPPRTATPAEGVAGEVKRGLSGSPPSHRSRTGFRVLVRTQQRANWLAGPEPQAVAPTGARTASAGVLPAFPNRSCHRCSEEGNGRKKKQRRKKKEKRKKRRKERGVAAGDDRHWAGR